MVNKDVYIGNITTYYHSLGGDTAAALSEFAICECSC